MAQARQQVAQSELRRVQAEGQERDTYQALIAAVGINATARLKVENSAMRRLPAPADVPLDSMVKLALAQRPDGAASYSALAASRAGIKAAEAEILPKVFVAGAIASGNNSFNANGLPTIGQQATGSGLLLDATMPLYDAGLRAAQLKQAQARAEAAENTFRRAQTDALRRSSPPAPRLNPTRPPARSLPPRRPPMMPPSKPTAMVSARSPPPVPPITACSTRIRRRPTPMRAR